MHVEELVAALRALGHEVVVAGPGFYERSGFGQESRAVALLRRLLPGPLSELAELASARLVSDVPLGAFLSGGVDSSAVVATAARPRSSPLDTFTIGFDGGEDETPYAALAAARYGATQHGERAATVDMIDAARCKAASSASRSATSPPCPPTASAVSRAATRPWRCPATAATRCSGATAHRWHRMVNGVRRHAVGILARLYPKPDRAPRWLRAKHTLTELSLDSALGYAGTVTRIQHRRRALFSPALAAALDGHDPADRFASLMEESGSDDALLQAQYADLHTWLPGDILTKVDRASMAHGLEVRAPLLDSALLSWGLALPPELKLRGGEGKYLLKRALEPLLPHEVLYRPKQGFAHSPSALFRARAGRLRDRLHGGAMEDCGRFALPALARLIDEHASGAFDHGAALWLLLVFEGFLASEIAPGPDGRPHFLMTS